MSANGSTGRTGSDDLTLGRDGGYTGSDSGSSGDQYDDTNDLDTDLDAEDL